MNKTAISIISGLFVCVLVFLSFIQLSLDRIEHKLYSFESVEIVNIEDIQPDQIGLVEDEITGLYIHRDDAFVVMVEQRCGALWGEYDMETNIIEVEYEYRDASQVYVDFEFYSKDPGFTDSIKFPSDDGQECIRKND